MASEKKLNGTNVSVIRDDITLLDVQAFVYYAQHDLDLGSGWGNAISMRGGPTIKAELQHLGPLATGEAAVSGAGELKAEYIIHAVGPRFQEADTENKLKKTVLAALTRAEAKGVKSLAFPAMGCGFYGVALDLSARVTCEALRMHLSKGSTLKSIVLCCNDKREVPVFAAAIERLS